MTIHVQKQHPVFAAEVTNIDLRHPVGAKELAAIQAALHEHAVLIFRDQNLNDDQQIAFSSLFGPVEKSIGAISAARQTRLGSVMADISNIDLENKIRHPGDRWRLMQLANQHWHTDSSFKAVPGLFSFLSAREVPPDGGQTEFADMRAAYDALDESFRATIATLSAEHSIAHSRKLVGYDNFSHEELAQLPPVTRPLVRTIPESGRMSLYLASHASHIVGWPVQEGRKLLETLTSEATRPCFVYAHHWRVGDLVVWDNRCTMHRGRPYDDLHHRRDLRRITVSDQAFLAGDGIQVRTKLEQRENAP